MFPQNVGRMVLDGVADAEDYYSVQGKTALLFVLAISLLQVAC
jgi:hypothetical protein